MARLAAKQSDLGRFVLLGAAIFLGGAVQGKDLMGEGKPHARMEPHAAVEAQTAWPAVPEITGERASVWKAIWGGTCPEAEEKKTTGSSWS
ncbi:hypothetical protein RSK20926_15616 [Roseobacter sp. SK209-2-6]|nr:hypothetical protein RSK20926_15616 [Roseobacter sp. SK209-2-6]